MPNLAEPFVRNGFDSTHRTSIPVRFGEPLTRIVPSKLLPFVTVENWNALVDELDAIVVSEHWRILQLPQMILTAFSMVGLTLVFMGWGMQISPREGRRRQGGATVTGVILLVISFVAGAALQEFAPTHIEDSVWRFCHEESKVHPTLLFHFKKELVVAQHADGRSHSSQMYKLDIVPQQTRQNGNIYGADDALIRTLQPSHVGAHEGRDTPPEL